MSLSICLILIQPIILLGNSISVKYLGPLPWKQKSRFWSRMHFSPEQLLKSWSVPVWSFFFFLGGGRSLFLHPSPLQIHSKTFSFINAPSHYSIWNPSSLPQCYFSLCLRQYFGLCSLKLVTHVLHPLLKSHTKLNVTKSNRHRASVGNWLTDSMSAASFLSQLESSALYSLTFLPTPKICLSLSGRSIIITRRTGGTFFHFSQLTRPWCGHQLPLSVP